MKLLKHISLQDALLVLGIGLFLGGIGHFSRAVASIVGGLLCFLFVWMMERATPPENAARTEEIERAKRRGVSL